MEIFLNNNNTNSQTEQVKKIIKIRQCHHKVSVLYSLREFFKNDIKTYLEIGVHSGCSMSYVLLSEYPIKCVGIDLFEDTFYKDKLVLENIKSDLNKINVHKHEINLIKGNSSSNDIINKLNDTMFDLIFIDGDHSYEGVKNDFNNYYKFLNKKSGIMVFDDYNEAETNKGVFKFINELLKVYKGRYIGRY